MGFEGELTLRYLFERWAPNCASKFECKRWDAKQGVYLVMVVLETIERRMEI